jgi:hypothetical protein
MDIVQVILDDKHYRHFVCSLCVKVVALDALVPSNALILTAKHVCKIMSCDFQRILMVSSNSNCNRSNSNP